MGLELSVWGAPSIVWVVATLGLVSASVLDRFLDDDPDDSGDSGGMDDGMGGDDDLFGGGGGGGGGGEFDDFDGMDEWDDAFEGDEGGGADTDELEKRIDDLEAEVASLSSTVSTVRSENEEISGTVEEVEEDVRNLLDIYEMVTRGINPFVDESSGFDDVAGGGEGSFGLFDDEEDDETEELDEDVANADPDGFFDEELVEPGEEDGFDELDEGESTDELDDIEEDDGDPADAASATEPADEGDDMNDDGKSFSELKEEYDAGEADWADDGAETDADEDPFGDDAGAAGDSFEDDSESFEDDLEASLDDEDPFGDAAATDAADDGLEEGSFEADSPEEETFEADSPEEETFEDDLEESTEPARGATRGPAPGGDPAEANGDGFEYVDRDELSGSRRKPYLTELPGDYVGDLLVMEWLEFLVSASDVTDAVRAINYYERIEWVGPEAGDRLRDFLSGFGTIDRNVVDRPGTDRLVREHHTRSLRYITQLNGTSSHTVLLDRWDDLAGGSLLGGAPPEPAPRGRRRDVDRGGRSGGRRDNAAGRADGSATGRVDGSAAEHAGGRETANGRGGANRRHNGTSPRPMNDPNPRPDRTDPADGGWDDGR